MIDREGPEVYRGLAVLFLNSQRYWGGGWSFPRPGCFIPGNVPVSVEQEAGWALGSVWTSTEISTPQEFDPLKFQAVASGYTDCATQAILLYIVILHLSVRWLSGSDWPFG